MQKIKADNFQDIYREILLSFEFEAQLIAKSKMVSYLTFELTNPADCLVNLPKNWGWALVEGINRLSFEDKKLMNPGTAYIFRPNWAKKLEKEGGEEFDYAYGPILKRQVPFILTKLKHRAEREAIINIWDESHLINEQGRYQRRPCTLTMHFVPFGHVLNMYVTMRTVDVMNLLPYDVFHHCLLFRYICSVAGYAMGSFYFTADTAYYQKKRDTTGSVLNTIEKLKTMPRMFPPEESDAFPEKERFWLIDKTKELHDYFVESKHNYQYTLKDFQAEMLSELSDFVKNYYNAVLYLYCKKYKAKLPDYKDLGEFNVIYQGRNS